MAAGWPVISVDSKKKEFIGNFKNNGQEWSQESEAMNKHDFDQDALGKTVPYGIYDLAHKGTGRSRSRSRVGDWPTLGLELNRERVSPDSE